MSETILKQNDKSGTNGTPKSIFDHECSFLGYHSFESKYPDVDKVETSVYMLRLSRLVKSSDQNLRRTVKQKFGVTRIRDLVHSLCALYDHCLPENDVNYFYDSICDDDMFTICVLKKADQENEAYKCKEDEMSVYGSGDNLDAIEDFFKGPESIFKGVFSDQEEDDDDEEDDDEEEDECLTSGIKSFLEKSKGVKFDSKKLEIKETGRAQKPPLLRRLLACATFELESDEDESNEKSNHEESKEKPEEDKEDEDEVEIVIDINYIGVRSKYRNFGIGSYLVSLIQNQNLVGSYDAVIACSDNEAIKFYEKLGFSVDPILNSKFHSTENYYSDTTKMCFVPPYSTFIEQSSAYPRFVPIGEESSLVLDCETHSDQVGKDNFDVSSLVKMEDDYRDYQVILLYKVMIM